VYPLIEPTESIANDDIAIGPVVFPFAADKDLVVCAVAEANASKLNVFPDVNVAIYLFPILL
jgi:hypothetical protein